MTFQRIKPYGPDGYTFWISGIYKLVSYRRASYHAYFLRDGYNHWGDHVETPPARCPATGNAHWTTLAEAKAACERHAKTHTPSPASVRRAAKCLADILEQAEKEA